MFMMMMTYQNLFNLGYTNPKAARPRLHGKSTYEHPRWFPLSTIQIKHGELNEYASDRTAPVSNPGDLAQSKYLGRVYLSCCEVCVYQPTIAASVLVYFSVF
jgi:hypothetical protein